MFYSQPLQLENPQLRPLSSGVSCLTAINMDAGQNYTRPQSGISPMPYPPTVGYIQGLLPLMSTWVWDNMQAKLPGTFYLGGSDIMVDVGMSFGPGINGLKKIKG